MSLFDCIAIGLNGIVGSGIYLLIGPMAQVAGEASIVGTLACGVLCILIGLCFAELSGMYDRNGGAYVYAREAFGPVVGFAVGWMSLACGALSFAAVASGFAEALVAVAPGLEGVPGKPAIAAVLIASLGAINYFGVKAGVRTSNILTVTKLVPLLLMAGVGVFAVRPEVFRRMVDPASVPPASGSWLQAVASTAMTAVFMLSGFEYTAVPAGEAANARRNIPRSIIGSLLGAVLLYGILQTVAASLLGDVGAHSQPLTEVAALLFGAAGRWLVSAASLVSMAGFCAGSALVGPRYFTALAEGGYLPQAFLRIGKHQTPELAVLALTVASLTLALLADYNSLVSVSVLAMFAQFLPAVLSALFLRIRRPEVPRMYRLPGGLTIPVLATMGTGWIFWTSRPQASEWAAAGKILAAGFAVWGLYRLTLRWRLKSSSRVNAL